MAESAEATVESAKATVESAKAMADSAKAAADSAKAADNTAKATEAGNCQRAFKDGVEHLGSKKPSVRQGGAHALFHLALKDDGLRASIAGVLCAHIRETTGEKDYQIQNKDKPSTEMQSLLRLLFTTETVGEGRLKRFWDGLTPDLEGGYFRGVELEGARFRGARLRLAQFQEAFLWKAEFQEALLGDTQFQVALLKEAQFQGAWLNEAQFQGAWLNEAQFQGASLERAQFQGARMHGIRFHVADLKRAQFQGADLSQSRFQGARLFGSQFQGASLYMAGFQQAKFGQRSGFEDNPTQDDMVVEPGETVEQLKTSTFYGVSSEYHVRKSFAERINDRVDKESDFSGMIFDGGVTQELLAEVKEVLEAPVEQVFWFTDDADFKEKLARSLESEIGQPESHTPPKEVISGAYDKEDAGRWIQGCLEASETVLETN